MSWPHAPLGEVAEIVTGKTPSTKNKTNFGGNIPFVTPAELDAEGLITTTPRTLSETGVSGIRLVPENSVLVGCIGTLGKVGMAGKPLATNQQINSLVFDEAKIWPRFGYYATQRLRPEMERTAPSTTVKIISKSKFAELEIPLPPLEEQKRIARILDQADALRRLRARALDKLNTLGQAIFNDMFGNPLNASDVSLSDVLLAFGNGLQVEQDESGEGLPVTRIETIWNGKIDPHRVKWSSPEMVRAERFLLRPGDILFSHINSPEHIAKTAIYEGHPDQLLHGINLLRLQPDREKVSPYWLVTFLKTDPVRNFFRSRCKKAVNQASLNQKNLSDLSFELPDYDAQVIFSEKLAAISAQISVHVSSSEKFDTLFAATQYRAFRGEL